MPLHVELFLERNGIWYINIPAELSPDGKRHRQSTKTRNRRAAEKIRDEEEEKYYYDSFGVGQFKVSLTREEFLKQYLLYAQASLSARSYSLYEEIVKRVLDAVDWPPSAAALIEYWQARIDDKEIKPITANKERRTVRSALNWGVREKLLRRNPIASVPEWKVEEPATLEWFEPDEVEKILVELHEPYRPIVELALSAGLRLSEILSLAWGDFDRTKLPVFGKGSRQRYVPITSRMTAIVSKLRRGRKDEPADARIFPYTREQVGAAFARARDKAKVNKGHFHALRDTFSVWWVRSGGSIPVLSRILGHSTSEVTEKYYAHIPEVDVRAALEKMSGGILAETHPPKNRADRKPA